MSAVVEGAARAEAGLANGSAAFRRPLESTPLDRAAVGRLPISAAASFSRAAVFMDTTVAIDVVGAASDAEAERAVQRAFGWFAGVESACSRFDPRSEVARLSAAVGVAVPVSPLVFEVLQLALAVAEASDGTFDPTVGARLEAVGFDRNHRTGERVVSGIAPAPAGAAGVGGHRDVVLDAAAQTVTLRRPLVIDLGGIAKGFAIDLAACELAAFPGSVVNAGGDLFLRGRSAEGTPWRVGVRHPREAGALVDVLEPRDDVGAGLAVCTSGDYERIAAGGGHIVDPRSGDAPARPVVSATVVAPTAALADALGTAATVLGPERGLALLVAEGVDGMLVTLDRASGRLARHATPGYARLAAAPGDAEGARP